MPLPDHLEAIRAKVSNWGRWGEDDQLGTGNLLTPEAAQRGAAAVRSGRRFSLAVNLDLNGPQVGQRARRMNAFLTLTTHNVRDPAAPGMWAGTDDLVGLSGRMAIDIVDGQHFYTFDYMLP